MRIASFLFVLLAVSLSAQSGRGYYFTHSGEKISGYLEIKNRNIHYRIKEDDKEKVKLSFEQVKCLVIGLDSFIIEKVYRQAFDGETVSDYKVMQVLEVVRITLYKCVNEDQGGGLRAVHSYPESPAPMYVASNDNALDYVFYIRKDSILHQITREGFRRKIAPHIQDYPYIADLVKRKKMRHDELKYILILYNNHFKAQAAKP